MRSSGEESWFGRPAPAACLPSTGPTMNRSYLSLGAVLLLSGAMACARAPAATPTNTTPRPAGGRAGGAPGEQRAPGDSAVGDTATGAGRAGGAPSGAAVPRPYNRVITPQAVTRRGLFAVHRVGDRLFFEIPRS